MSGDPGWEQYLETRRNAPPDVVEVTFELPPERLPRRTESMWAQRVGTDLFQLRNSPFDVDGVSFLDTVRAEFRDGEWFFAGVHARSGHSTFRVNVAGRWRRAARSMVFAPLRRLGCAIEVACACWAAVDVPPSADVHAVVMALRRGEREGRWKYEVGHYGRATA